MLLSQTEMLFFYEYLKLEKVYKRIITIYVNEFNRRTN